MPSLQLFHGTFFWYFRGKIAPGTSSSLKVILSDLFFSLISTLLLSSSLQSNQVKRTLKIHYLNIEPTQAFQECNNELMIRIFNSLARSIQEYGYTRVPFSKNQFAIAFAKRLNTSRLGNAISELVFRKRNPLAVFLNRASERVEYSNNQFIIAFLKRLSGFNIQIMNSLM